MASNKAAFGLALVAVVVVVTLLVEAPTTAEAGQAKCDITELIPCAGAFMSNKVKASEGCCSKLRVQGGVCLCQYKKDYPSYADTDNAKRVVKDCKLKVPC